MGLGKLFSLSRYFDWKSRLLILFPLREHTAPSRLRREHTASFANTLHPVLPDRFGLVLGIVTITEWAERVSPAKGPKVAPCCEYARKHFRSSLLVSGSVGGIRRSVAQDVRPKWSFLRASVAGPWVGVVLLVVCRYSLCLSIFGASPRPSPRQQGPPRATMPTTSGAFPPAALQNLAIQ